MKTNKHHFMTEVIAVSKTWSEVIKSICYRGAVFWNFVLDYFKDSCGFKPCYRKEKSNPTFREIRFTSSSHAQSVANFWFLILNYLKLYEYILHCHVSTLQFDYLFDIF